MYRPAYLANTKIVSCLIVKVIGCPGLAVSVAVVHELVAQMETTTLLPADTMQLMSEGNTLQK